MIKTEMKYIFLLVQIEPGRNFVTIEKLTFLKRIRQQEHL